MTKPLDKTALTKAEWQTELFSMQPRRAELLKFRTEWPLRTIKLRVHRNHAFEPVGSMMEPYAAFGAWRAELTYSDYSDTLDFSAGDVQADAELVWVDRSRYQGLDDAGLVQWLAQRLNHLRRVSTGPILAMVSGGNALLEQRLDESA
jgi:hypothetical protein